MSKLINDLLRSEVLNIEPYVPGKPIEEVKRELGVENVVKMASNENPLGPSPLALDALKDAIADVNVYPDAASYYLRNGLAQYLDVDPSWLITGNGGDDIISLIAKTFVNTGDEILMTDPSFHPYQSTTKIMGGVLVFSPLKDYRTDLQDFLRKITPKTKLVFLNTPHNPTGTTISKDELDGFIHELPEGIIVVIDEAYGEYADGDDLADSLSYLRQGVNMIVIRTLSKIYGLAGLRVGYGVTQPEMASYMNRIREPFNVNLLAQVAALAALKDEEHLRRSREMVRDGREFLYRELTEMGLSYAPSQANFILIDVGLDSQTVHKELMTKGIIIRPGHNLGYPNHIRLTVGTREDNERFIRVLKELFNTQI